MDIEKLAIEYQKGNQKAFNLIYKETYKMVKIAIYRYVQEKTTIDDLIQETYFKFSLSIKDYNPESGKVSNLLYTMAKNNAIDYLKKKRETRLDENIELSSNNEMSPYLRFAISKLDDEEREIFLLKVLGSFTTKSLSHALGLKTSDINKIYYTAIKKLKKELKGTNEI